VKTGSREGSAAPRDAAPDAQPTRAQLGAHLHRRGQQVVQGQSGQREHMVAEHGAGALYNRLCRDQRGLELVHADRGGHRV